MLSHTDLNCLKLTYRWLLGTTVSQALAVTPIPGIFADRISDAVQENSREFVHKWTDPRRQAAARQNVSRAGSSVWQIARGGGGTSRASQSPPPPSRTRTDGLSPTAGIDAETGEFSIITSQHGQATNEPVLSVSSVHSYNARDNVQVTTVVTVSFLAEDSGASAVRKAKAAGLDPGRLDMAELAQASLLGPSMTTSQPMQAHPPPMGRPAAHGQARRTPKDSTAITGRDW